MVDLDNWVRGSSCYGQLWISSTTYTPRCDSKIPFVVKVRQNRSVLIDAIQNHVKSNTIKVIEGTYHQTQKVIHYVDPSTGINVIKDYQGKFISN